jgi:hypothetical protein
MSTRSILTSVAAVLALQMAGCGGDDGQSEGGPSTAAEPSGVSEAGGTSGAEDFCGRLGDHRDAEEGSARARYEPVPVPCADWRPYSDTSPFNREIPPSPRVDPNSEEIVNRTLGFGNNLYFWGGTAGSEADWASPIYYSKPTDPLFTLHCWRYECPELEGRKVRVPDRAQPAQSVDAHMAIVDRARSVEYDLSRVTSKPAGGGVLELGSGGTTAFGTPAADGRRGDSTAAGFGLLAGIIRPAELAAGVIDHALVTGVRCTNGVVWPAGANTGTRCASLGMSEARAPKMGQHFQLVISDAEIDALDAPDWRKAILRALARYGMFVGDTSGPNGSLGISAESTQSWLSFGLPDPWVTLGDQYGVPTWRDSHGVLRYLFDARPGVDWESRLRVLAPCVSRGTC